MGADQFPVQGGESLLAYRTPDDFTADEELDLTAPVRTAPGLPVIVNVRAYTTTVASRPGATVLGAGSPVQTDVNGNATVSFPAPGTYQLTAAGDYNDIPSPTLSVCVAAQPDRDCPAERGREILGSDEAEGIKGTDGDDLIRPRGGNDGVEQGGMTRSSPTEAVETDLLCGGTDIAARRQGPRVEELREGSTRGKKKHHKEGQEVVKLVRILAAALALGATAVAAAARPRPTGDVDLTVTRDWGPRPAAEAGLDPRMATVFRVLDRNADITTRFGGGFVQSIDGPAVPERRPSQRLVLLRTHRVADRLRPVRPLPGDRSGDYRTDSGHACAAVSPLAGAVRTRVPGTGLWNDLPARVQRHSATIKQDHGRHRDDREPSQPSGDRPWQAVQRSCRP